MTMPGFQANTTAIGDAAQRLATQAAELGKMSTESLDARAFGELPQSPQVHGQYSATAAQIRSQVDSAASRLSGIGGSLTESADSYRSYDTRAADQHHAAGAPLNEPNQSLW